MGPTLKRLFPRPLASGRVAPDLEERELDEVGGHRGLQEARDLVHVQLLQRDGIAGSGLDQKLGVAGDATPQATVLERLNDWPWHAAMSLGSKEERHGQSRSDSGGPSEGFVPWVAPSNFPARGCRGSDVRFTSTWFTTGSVTALSAAAFVNASHERVGNPLATILVGSWSTTGP